MWDRAELAWAAGVEFSMTDEEPIRRFQRIVGLGKVVGPYRSPSVPVHYKPKWFFTVANGEGVQQVLILLWPWLGPRRRAQARAVLVSMRYRPRGRVGAMFGKPKRLLNLEEAQAYDRSAKRKNGPRGPCAVDGCQNERHARGMCEKHDYRLRLYGDVNTTRIRYPEHRQPRVALALEPEPSPPERMPSCAWAA